MFLDKVVPTLPASRGSVLHQEPSPDNSVPPMQPWKSKQKLLEYHQSDFVYGLPQEKKFLIVDKNHKITPSS